MKAFLTPFEDMPQIEDLKEQLQRNALIYEISGCMDAQKAHLIYGIGHDQKVKLIVTYDELRAKTLYEQYRFFQANTFCFPAKDLLFYQSDIRGNALTKERMAVIQQMLESSEYTVITTFDALMNRMVNRELYRQGAIRLSTGEEVDLSCLQGQLAALGYERVTQVEQGGEFALRGGILDVYPLTMDLPVRIELWGDEVDSIRTFDAEGQKSIEEIEEVNIYPAMELVLSREMLEEGLRAMEADAEELHEQYRREMKTEEAHRILSATRQVIEEAREWGMSAELETHLPYFCGETVSLLDYLPKDAVIYVDEGKRVLEQGHQVEQEFSQSMERRMEMGYLLPRERHMLYAPQETLEKLFCFRVAALSTLDMGAGALPVEKRYHVRTKSVNAYNNHFDLLLRELKQYKKQKYRMILVSSSRSRAGRLADQLMEEGLSAFATEDYDHLIYPGEIMVISGSVRQGYEYPESRFAVLSENDIFGRRHAGKKRVRRYEGEKIAGFSDLTVGDYVVHENHGLGIYQGIEQMEVDKVQKDYIKISYAKGGNLYILATQLNAIQKYGSKDGKKPKLNVLGTQEWSRTKGKVKAAVGQVAKELVELYALRQNHEGYVYGPDTVWQREFEESFPYEETEGQLQAIEAVKQDMMSPKIMDRLICGDVGYGKTEVAIRAAFKAVQEGKQVVYLVPTTILAQQHYHTFAMRMQQYPVNVELLCRFCTPAQQKKTIEGLKSGETDIVIGTHRLLSKDVCYKDLGLLIIDEEQRFGVTHKEKIKQLKKTVDVLSLSATPIPRTLHMSLIGIRDMSVLEEAPMERRPIQTFVFEYNEEMIREAVIREMARGGQVYYVFNRVARIADMAAKISELVPEATVAYAHGKMAENQLEQIMYSFINQEIDVLVSTTIIEIGLDISNVNTIMIHDADNLGLAQLYQLRGRVGRSNRMAYAFLMYRRDKLLKEVAEKRLAAIKEYTDLGSGFRIAMRDLEIRGAGNLLGEEQHGHMAAVGYDLYCKMLNEAVKKEKGLSAEETFETVVELDMDAYIPAAYIAGEQQRLDIYKRIAEITEDGQREEMLDELIDRFGEPPRPVLNLLLIARIRAQAHRCYVTELSEKAGKVRFDLYPKAGLQPEKIPGLVEQYAPFLTFAADVSRPAFVYDYERNTRMRKRELPDWILGFLADLQNLAREKVAT